MATLHNNVVPSSGVDTSILWGGDRGVFGGAYDNTTIDYITISSTGNATDFGDMTSGRQGYGACSNGTRGVFGGGRNSSVAKHDTIDYITISSTGNATDFGNLTLTRTHLAACSNGTRGLFGGGESTDAYPNENSNRIDYITISSTGNATDFGDLTSGRRYLASCSSETRGVWAGGNSNSGNGPITDYVTIASAGNATNFGDMPVSCFTNTACSSAERGLITRGGYDSIYYITIATTGSAATFGNRVFSGKSGAAASNGERAVFTGGVGEDINIDYVTIATTGNCTDFGDLTLGRTRVSGTSGD
jgi:hypothetical protein